MFSFDSLQAAYTAEGHARGLALRRGVGRARDLAVCYGEGLARGLAVCRGVGRGRGLAVCYGESPGLPQGHCLWHFVVDKMTPRHVFLCVLPSFITSIPLYRIFFYLFMFWFK